MEKMPIAAQVYSVREEAGVDFAGTMKQLKSLGYDGVELAGLYGRTPDEIKGWLEEANEGFRVICFVTYSWRLYPVSVFSP